MIRRRQRRRRNAILAAGALFALPLLAIVYQAVSVLNVEIVSAQKEQFGMEYHIELIDLLESLQKLRGLRFMAHKGHQDMAAQLAAQEKEVRAWIIKIDRINTASQALFGMNTDWQNIKHQINDLFTSPPPMAEEFETYTHVIEALNDFTLDVADDSSMTFDPRLNTAYLADAMVITPDILVNSGKIRGLTSGWLASGMPPSQWPEDEVHELRMLYGSFRNQADDIRHSLQRAERLNTEASVFVAYHDQILQAKLQHFQENIEAIIFQKQPNVSAQDFFHSCTEIIEGYDEVYDYIGQYFIEGLRQRIHENRIKQLLVMGSSAIGLLGLGILLVFLHRNLARTEQAEMEAQKANRIKTEFLANMSHELRTPLNSILGMNRLLMESDLPAEQHDLAQIAFQASVNLLEIVNDILDLSKIEANEVKLEHIGFDPRYVLDGVCLTLKQLAKEKSLALLQPYQQHPLPYVIGDPARLSKVLMNLVSNAIKYTDKGHVAVRAQYTPLAEGRVELRCEIADSGIGIPPDKHKTIFDKFVQADASTTRKYGGTGLGLAITKQLVELMGGHIGVESEMGQGSLFWIAIPFAVTDKLSQDKHIRRKPTLRGTIPAEKARILVAEDHPLNQLFMKKLFKKFGITQFEIVENGMQALDAYKNRRWDAILMDCHMPEKNGYEATKDIRHLEQTTGMHVPIIAMTASAMVGDKEKCLQYGMDEYISKPINIGELKEILSQWLVFPQAED